MKHLKHPVQRYAGHSDRLIVLPSRLSPALEIRAKTIGTEPVACTVCRRTVQCSRATRLVYPHRDATGTICPGGDDWSDYGVDSSRLPIAESTNAGDRYRACPSCQSRRRYQASTGRLRPHPAAAGEGLCPGSHAQVAPPMQATSTSKRTCPACGQQTRYNERRSYFYSHTLTGTTRLCGRDERGGGAEPLERTPRDGTSWHQALQDWLREHGVPAVLTPHSLDRAGQAPDGVFVVVTLPGPVSCPDLDELVASRPDPDAALTAIASPLGFEFRAESKYAAASFALLDVGHGRVQPCNALAQELARLVPDEPQTSDQR